jgi:hypothetical protein
VEWVNICEKCVQGVLVRKPEGKRLLEELDMHGTIGLK